MYALWLDIIVFFRQMSFTSKNYKFHSRYENIASQQPILWNYVPSLIVQQRDIHKVRSHLDIQKHDESNATGTGVKFNFDVKNKKINYTNWYELFTSCSRKYFITQPVNMTHKETLFYYQLQHKILSKPSGVTRVDYYGWYSIKMNLG